MSGSVICRNANSLILIPGQRPDELDGMRTHGHKRICWSTYHIVGIDAAHLVSLLFHMMLVKSTTTAFFIYLPMIKGILVLTHSSAGSMAARKNWIRFFNNEGIF